MMSQSEVNKVHACMFTSLHLYNLYIYIYNITSIGLTDMCEYFGKIVLAPLAVGTDLEQ